MRRAVLVALTVLACLLPSGGEASAETPAPFGETEKSIALLGKELTDKYHGRPPVSWGERLPGVVTSLDGPEPGGDAPTGRRTMALTLDACEGGTDTRIIGLLRKHGIPATIFATSRWLRANTTIARELAADPLFIFACHGARHKPASVNGRAAYGINGTRTIAALVDEVESNARALTALTGIRPSWYRSGTAHYDDVALEVIHDLGLAVAGYTVSADAGASLPAEDVARLLRKAPDRAIILCHLNHPESGTFTGLARALPGMLEKGVVFVPLNANALREITP